MVDTRTLSNAVAAGEAQIDPRLSALEQGKADNFYVDEALANKIDVSSRNAANGVAGLGSDSKIPITLLPEAILGALNFQTFWNAATNSPLVQAASSANKGQFYVVTVEGDTEIDGISDWKVGDWVVSLGTTWGKIDSSDQVISVCGKQGVVTLDIADIDGLSDAISAIGDQIATLSGGLSSLGATVDEKMAKDANGSDINNKATFRTNLGVYGKSETDTQIDGALAGEVTARNTAIGNAVAAEATARNAAIGSAVAAEATSRGEAIDAAIAAEEEARDEAIAAEEAARNDAIADAVAAEASARLGADAALNDLIADQGVKLDTALQPSDIGTSVQAFSTILAATTASFTTTLKGKLDGIAIGATKNDTDANLKNRVNHTGEQAISTITGLQSALDGKSSTSHTHTFASLTSKPTTLSGYGITDGLLASSYTAADVLAKVKTVDGAGSGLDADLLDGKQASEFATSAQGGRADSAVQPATLAATLEGYAPLDETDHIPAQYLPSYVDDVEEYDTLADFPAVGEKAKIYTDLSTNNIYRWSGSIYIEIAASPGSTDAVAEGTTNLYFTAARVRAAVLTGLSLASSAVVNAADTVLSALGKLQAQVSALQTGKSDVGHTHTFASLTSKPTTLSGYGITDAQAALGFTPVQQGGGTGQGTNKVRLGYATDASGLKLQIDSADMGLVWTDKLAQTSPGRLRDLLVLATLAQSGSASDLSAGTVPDARLPARIGGLIAPVLDWNDAKATGWYHGNPSTPNAPTTGRYIGVVMRLNDDTVSQEVYAFTSASAANTFTYRRESAGGIWGDWYKLQLSQAEQDARYLTPAIADSRLPARLGVIATSVASWNDVSQSGWYISSGDTPESGTFIGTVEAQSANLMVQTVRWAGASSSTTVKWWQRIKTGSGTWTAWYKLQLTQDEQDARYLTPAIADSRLPTRLGVNSELVTDWNDATENGFYRSVADASTNAPVNGSWFGTVLRWNAGTIIQTITATSGNTASTATYRRKWSAGTWSAWYVLLISRDEQDARFAALAHTHTFASLTSKPTTLSGYGITDAQGSLRKTSNFELGAELLTDSSAFIDFHTSATLIDFNARLLRNLTANGALDIIQKGTGAIRFISDNTGFTFNNNNIYHAGNDGANSGLDADLLDGKHASEFATSTQGGRADSAVQSIMVGFGLDVDNSDPQNPQISLTGSVASRPSTILDYLNYVKMFDLATAAYSATSAISDSGYLFVGGAVTYQQATNAVNGKSTGRMRSTGANASGNLTVSYDRTDVTSGEFEVIAVLQVDALSGASPAPVYILEAGLVQPNGNTSSGHYTAGFRYRDTENSGKWQYGFQNNTTAAWNDSGVAVAAATTYALRVLRDESGDVKFYINGTLVGTVVSATAAPLLAALAAQCTAGFSTYKTGGPNAVNYDFLALQYVKASPFA